MTAHGFATGGIDGIVGPNTRGALEAFQKAKGLQQTARADALTVSALRQSSSRVSGFVRPQEPDDRAEPMQAQRFPRQRDMATFYGPHGQN